MGIKVNLKNVRVNYVHVFNKSEDKVNEDKSIKKGRYEYTVYLKEGDPQLSKLESAVRDELTEKLGSASAADKWMERNYGFGNWSEKCAVRDLAEREKPIEGMETGLHFKAVAHKRPKIQTSLGETQIERGLTIDGDDIEGKEVYSGCYANVSVEVYWYGKFKNLCVNALGIRFKDDGEAFGGQSEYADDDDLGDDDDAPARKPKPRTSRRDADEEEEHPRRRSRSRVEEDDEDEEEEERPRRRSR